MEFLYTDLGILYGGEEFEVRVSRRANVFLLDGYNFSKYQMGLSFDYRGGLVTNGVIRITIPSPGKWYIIIDLAGEHGYIKYDIREVARLTKAHCYFSLPDRTTVYFDEFSDGSVCLTSIVRDGMMRSNVERTFRSINDLKRFCMYIDWSKL